MDMPSNISDLVSAGSDVQLEAQAVVGATTYLLVTETTVADTAGEKILALAGDGTARILASSSVIYADQVDPAVAAALRLPAGSVFSSVPFPPAEAGRSQHTAEDIGLSDLSIEQVAKRVFDAALKATERLKSDNVDGTKRGRLACAWAVNTVVSGALGDPIGGGKSTAEMVKVLRKYHFPIEADQKSPGSIIIAATVGRTVGHVGIVGEGDDIHSNSSSRAIFRKGPSLADWMRNYDGLKTEYFELNPRRFPKASLTS